MARSDHCRPPSASRSGKRVAGAILDGRFLTVWRGFELLRHTAAGATDHRGLASPTNRQRVPIVVGNELEFQKRIC